MSAAKGRGLSGGRWIAAAMALAMIPPYLATAGKIVDHDLFAMAQVARMVLDGRPLYGTAWDNKPPLALLYYTPPQWVAPGSYAALQMQMLAVACLQAAMLLAALRDRPAWVGLTAAAMAMLLPLLDFGFAWSSSEDAANLLALPVLLGSYRIAVGRRVGRVACLVMGASLVLAFHARQTTMFYGALPALALLGSPTPARSRAAGVLMGLGGVALGLAIVAGLILGFGDWRGYVHTVFEVPRLYQGHYWNAIEGLFAMRSSAVPLLLAVATTVMATRGTRAQRAFFLAVAVVAVAVVMLPMRPFAHYWKQAFPALCLMVPEALHRLSPRKLPRAVVGGLLGYLAANAALTCGYMGLVRTNLSTAHASRSKVDAVVARIKLAARPGDTLLAVGPESAYFQFASGLAPSSDLFWDFFLKGTMIELSGRDPAKLFASYRASPPGVLVVAKSIEADVREGRAIEGRPEFRALMAFLLAEAGYEPAVDAGDYRIYRRPRQARGDQRPSPLAFGP